VIAVDRREPSEALRSAAPGVTWERVDIAVREEFVSVLQRARAVHGRIDFLVHFAAFYDPSPDWLPEYERTNITGTSNVITAAADAGVGRVLFASSMVAMAPAPKGEVLTERSPTWELIPYAKSKAIGEEMVAAAAPELPATILRIGGVFSDWCELPPLWSLIRLWARKGLLGRVIPGRGETGFPYLHRSDLVALVRRGIERDGELAGLEFFLASQPDVVLHNDLFPVIRRTVAGTGNPKPIFVPRRLAKAGLYLQCAAGALCGRRPFEHPWMLDLVDRPWVVDNSHTREKLGWDCAPGMDILDRLPLILERFHADRQTWEKRNAARNEGDYAYHP